MNRNLDNLVPSQIVEELDKYIIGQKHAKKTIAIAIRNRSRRKKLSKEMQEEVSPKNIIMIGPTGVGKTEIARRISKLANTPFLKVEATKYTEVGYVGRDVESMIRDLMSISLSMVKKEMAKDIEDKVKETVEKRILELLLPNLKDTEVDKEAKERTRDIFAKKLKNGEFEDKEIEIQVSNRNTGSSIGVLGGSGMNMGDIEDAMQSIGSIFGNKSKTRKVSVSRARDLLRDEEVEKQLDQDKAIDIAKERCEQMGIIFIDEIDKIAVSTNRGSGADVSREGVQRDILPIVEGTVVNTKYGMIDTKHILFIGSGAFHLSKPSDLIPELQGRFPLRVELDSLNSDDFYRILIEPENALIKQYQALLATENVTLEFKKEALKRISEIAQNVNSNTENIGARRLHTILEQLLEDLSYNANELNGQNVVITKEYVDEKLKEVVTNQDLSRYIL